MDIFTDTCDMFILAIIGAIALFAGSFTHFVIFGHVQKQVGNVKKAASLLMAARRKRALQECRPPEGADFINHSSIAPIIDALILCRRNSLK